MIQEVESDGVIGWRWGDDGTIYYGPQGKRMALREGAELDPRAFASLQSEYEVITSGEDLEWNVPPTDTVINLD
jgi:hypothetical protein